MPRFQRHAQELTCVEGWSDSTADATVTNQRKAAMRPRLTLLALLPLLVGCNFAEYQRQWENMRARAQETLYTSSYTGPDGRTLYCSSYVSQYNTRTECR